MIQAMFYHALIGALCANAKMLHANEIRAEYERERQKARDEFMRRNDPNVIDIECREIKSMPLLPGNAS